MMRRSKLEIYIDVLSKIREGKNQPSKIMNATNLSYLTLKNVLKSLEEQGLISKSKIINVKGRRKTTSNYYEQTKKAVQVLNYFEKVDDVIKSGTNVLNPISEMVNQKRTVYNK